MEESVALGACVGAPAEEGALDSVLEGALGGGGGGHGVGSSMTKPTGLSHLYSTGVGIPFVAVQWILQVRQVHDVFVATKRLLDPARRVVPRRTCPVLQADG